MLLFMALLGCGHLLFRDHYFIINYDSFQFHHLARMVLDGEHVAVIGSGLAYPIAVAGRVIGLDTATMMISPLFGILTGLILYWGVSRLYSPTVALYSVVCFVFAQIPRFVFMSGNIDRDGLHMLIMTVGFLGLALYLKTHERRYLALTIATVPLLYLEWGGMAFIQYIPALIGTILLSFGGYRSKWMWFGIGLLALGAYLIGRGAMYLVTSVDVSELEPFNLYSAIQYVTIAIPFAFGMKVIQNRKEDFIILAWFLSFILMGFVASRLSLYAVVPACIIGGIGIEGMRNGLKLLDMSKEWKFLFAVGCLIFVGLSWVVPTNVKMDNDWHDALVWVKENTPENAEVAAWWSYGYWIRDVGERDAKLTIGMVNTKSKDMAEFYCAPSESEARQIMLANHWDYVIMSSREEKFMGSIEKRAKATTPAFYEEVMARMPLDKFDRAYQNETVVILKIRC